MGLCQGSARKNMQNQPYNRQPGPQSGVAQAYPYNPSQVIAIKTCHFLTIVLTGVSGRERMNAAISKMAKWNLNALLEAMVLLHTLKNLFHFYPHECDFK